MKNAIQKRIWLDNDKIEGINNKIKDIDIEKLKTMTESFSKLEEKYEDNDKVLWMLKYLKYKIQSSIKDRLSKNYIDKWTDWTNEFM